MKLTFLMELVRTGPLVVLAAVIRHEGKYLITKRLPSARWNAERWEFPGGKLEFGEELEACLEREIREETGLEIMVGEILTVSSHIYGDELHILLIGFSCDLISGSVVHAGIADHRWITVDELDGFDMTEADLILVDTVRKRNMKF